MVLSYGRLMEFDEPSKLIANPCSQFNKYLKKQS